MGEVITLRKHPIKCGCGWLLPKSLGVKIVLDDEGAKLVGHGEVYLNPAGMRVTFDCPECGKTLEART